MGRTRTIGDTIKSASVAAGRAAEVASSGLTLAGADDAEVEEATARREARAIGVLVRGGGARGPMPRRGQALGRARASGGRGPRPGSGEPPAGEGPDGAGANSSGSDGRAKASGEGIGRPVTADGVEGGDLALRGDVASPSAALSAAFRNASSTWGWRASAVACAAWRVTRCRSAGRGGSCVYMSCEAQVSGHEQGVTRGQGKQRYNVGQRSPHAEVRARPQRIKRRTRDEGVV